jgi:hypothetical protein
MERINEKSTRRNKPGKPSLDSSIVMDADVKTLISILGYPSLWVAAVEMSSKGIGIWIGLVI